MTPSPSDPGTQRRRSILQDNGPNGNTQITDATKLDSSEKPPPNGKNQQSSKPQKETTEGKSAGKEAKLKAKAEKAARREKEKQAKQLPISHNPKEVQGGSSEMAQQLQAKPQSSSKSHHRRKSSAGAHAQRALALRPADPSNAPKPEEPKKEDKRVALFEHLYGHPRRHTLAGASKDIHPSVLTLGLQFSSYKILGSNARCAATLLALQEVITAYTTPIGNSLPRHLTTHLANQIDYLVSCRPLSVAQGNAIRWLKVKISAVDVATPEDRAKSELCIAIDEFIRERIVVADDVIAAHAGERIRDGDTVLTYARSTIVEKTLLKSHEEGRKFKVIVVDSRPLFEGRTLAHNLAHAGIQVQYSLISGLSHVAPNANKAILGAHAVLANGSLYSRVGTAMVALTAKSSQIPVMICCESVKLSERAALDSFVQNELAPEDELVPLKGDEGSEEQPLAKWRDVPGLKLLNLMYDVTPAQLIDLVITEHGNMPPTSVLAVGRMSANA